MVTAANLEVRVLRAGAIGLTLTLLSASAVFAAPGGLPGCMMSLDTCASSLNECSDDLSDCATILVVEAACGNGAIDTGEQCDQANLSFETCATQGFAGGTLQCGAGCVFDTSACSATRFIDNGDGTVSDLRTRLMWEKKIVSDPLNPDEQDYRSTWSWCGDEPSSFPRGTAFTRFLAELNLNTLCDPTDAECHEPVFAPFAGHSDWHLPTVAELQTILDMSVPGCNTILETPCIDPIFGPTASDFYWTSTSFTEDIDFAWYVHFRNGQVGWFSKIARMAVRAVRRM